MLNITPIKLIYPGATAGGTTEAIIVLWNIGNWIVDTAEMDVLSASYNASSSDPCHGSSGDEQYTLTGRAYR